MAHKMHLFQKKRSEEMSLCPMRPKFSIEAVVGGSKIKPQTSLPL
ncbi:hypothetical protein E2C01_044744 [Portunus trituberculatus]|uniref:Uncharacterized protein n=1 Tax=Portunus trituberculatus TaxID=210409 RepID=A0A5B7FTW9_PORTR|nr:hypothetical protein [Portunus trituberculatus]